MIAFDNNLIAYEYYKDQFVPKEVYPSGEKDETKLIDKYSFSNKNPAVLILEDDIISKDGKGLKKGFYQLFPHPPERRLPAAHQQRHGAHEALLHR